MKLVRPKPNFYACTFQPLKEIAKDMGYNLVLHGSANPGYGFNRHRLDGQPAPGIGHGKSNGYVPPKSAPVFSPNTLSQSAGNS